eukprot:7872662-Pyramimonas_sp.AAC.1
MSNRWHSSSSILVGHSAQGCPGAGLQGPPCPTSTGASGAPSGSQWGPVSERPPTPHRRALGASE